MSRMHGNSNHRILCRQKDLIDFLKENIDIFLGATDIFQYH